MSIGSRSALRSLVCLALGCVLVASLLAGCGSGRAGLGDREVERYTLGNGLTVILLEDDRVPIAAVNLWYHVGPANEAAGRTGFAHLFEHLMTGKGSGHIPAGEAEKALDGAGATGVNASTFFDRTNFFETVPSNALEIALWRESDRMGFLLDALGQAPLSNQQSVVRNERRQTREATVLGLTEEAMYRELFGPGHPYHADVIGSHADIQAARLDEVRDFFKRYYVPNNASLAIVGNIDPDATKAMIEKYFGGIPRGADVPDPRVDTPALTGEKRLTMTQNVIAPVVTMAWVTPPAYAPGDAEANVTAHLLGGGTASRLYDALVRTGIAFGVTVSQQSLALGSVFAIQVGAKPGHSAQEVESVIQRELDRFAKDGPTPTEVTAAQAAIRTRLLSHLEHPSGLADALNAYNQYTGDASYLDKDLRRYTDVTADAVQRFAAEQLRGDRRLVIHSVPGPNVLPPEPPTPPAPPADPPPAPSAEPWRSIVPRPGPVSTAPLPRAQRFELANGLPVYLMESHTVPLVVGLVVSRWDSAADPPGRPGLAAFTVGMLDQGTASRDAGGIARELDALGATLGAAADIDLSAVGVSALREHIGPAMAVMSDVVRAPSFPPAEVEAIRSRRLLDLGYYPGTIAQRVMRREVYGQDHPYGHLATGSEQAVRSISRDDLVEFHRRAFTPRTCALVLAGDLTLEAARKLAEDSFGGWTGDGADPPPPRPPAPTPNRVLAVDYPGSVQTTLLLAQPAVARSDPDYDTLLILNQVLSNGSSLAGRLNVNLRQRHGYTYGAFSELSGDRGVGTLALSSSVQPAFTGASVREMLGEVAGLQNAPVSAEELDGAKQAFIRSLPSSFVTNGGSAVAIGALYLYDLPADYYDQVRARVATIDAAQVQQAARAHLRPEEMKVIAVGEKSVIAPQLEALNLGPIAYRNADGTPAP